MSSAERDRAAQSGQSLVEALIASALMGIAVVVGLTSIQSAQKGAQRAVQEAWAQCAVRSVADAVQGSRWESGPGAYAGVKGVAVTVSGPAGGSPGDVQTVTIVAVAPGMHTQLFRATLLKSFALQGQDPFATALPRINSGCPAP